MTKKQAREEMVYLVYTSILLAVITKGCQDRNSHGIGTPTVGGGGAQELMERPWRAASYWLAPYSWLSLLSYRI